MVPATESIIPLPFNGLRRVAASEDWPFLAEIGRNTAIFGNLGAKIGHLEAEFREWKHIKLQTTK